MTSFREFLHGDNWKKPLLPDLTKAMVRITQSGQGGSKYPDSYWRTAQIAPPHQKLMMALARAGARGLTRGEITGLVDLDSGTLNDVVNALVRSGELEVSQGTDGQRVYRRLI
jgi:DNA-binding MarR family transcriptional regulator